MRAHTSRVPSGRTAPPAGAAPQSWAWKSEITTTSRCALAAPASSRTARASASDGAEAAAVGRTLSSTARRRARSPVASSSAGTSGSATVVTTAARSPAPSAAMSAPASSSAACRRVGAPGRSAGSAIEAELSMTMASAVGEEPHPCQDGRASAPMAAAITRQRSASTSRSRRRLRACRRGSRAVKKASDGTARRVRARATPGA